MAGLSTLARQTPIAYISCMASQLRTEQALAAVFDRANEKGRRLGYGSEQQVYDAIGR